MKHFQQLQRIPVLLMILLGIGIACSPTDNAALKYANVDASGYAEDCEAFFTECVGQEAKTAQSSCDWINDATEVPPCVRDAMKEMLDCWNYTVDGEEVTHVRNDQINACGNDYNSKAEQCYNEF